jgi:hypothetical protein
MSAGSLNLTIEQGADWSLTMTWTIDGSAVDLTTYTARMQARREYKCDEAVIDIESPTNITLDVNGGILVELTAAETAEIPARRYVYDLELEDANGVVTRLVEGEILVKAEVTR